MIVYLDSSVLLRIVLGQPERLREWGAIEASIASALVEVECLRTLDRLRVRNLLDQKQLEASREAVFAILRETRIVYPTRMILARAAQPFPVPLGTLDAIHLSTALVWQEKGNDGLVLATHDMGLAAAARASGLTVLGSP